MKASYYTKRALDADQRNLYQLEYIHEIDSLLNYSLYVFRAGSFCMCSTAATISIVYDSPDLLRRFRQLEIGKCIIFIRHSITIFRLYCYYRSMLKMFRKNSVLNFVVAKNAFRVIKLQILLYDFKSVSCYIKSHVIILRIKKYIINFEAFICM